MRWSCGVFLLSWALVGCLQTENSSEGDDALIGATGDFAVAQEAFATKCANCHNFHTLTEDQLIATGRVIPGDADNSPLYNRCIGSASPVGTKNMPPSGAPLSTVELEALVNWINGITP